MPNSNIPFPLAKKLKEAGILFPESEKVIIDYRDLADNKAEWYKSHYRVAIRQKDPGSDYCYDDPSADELADRLPDTIYISNNNYWFEILKVHKTYTLWFKENSEHHVIKSFDNSSLASALTEALLWCAENGYLKEVTNANS